MSIFKRRSPEAVKCSRCGHWLEPAPQMVLDPKVMDRVCTGYQCQTCGKWVCTKCTNAFSMMAGCACGGTSFVARPMVRD